MDHYEVLGVAPDASKAAIRRAYLVQARRFHPDFHGNDPAARERAEHRMRLVNRAWEELFGYTREEVLSGDFDLMKIVAPESKPLILDRLRRRKQGEPV
ncbi:MAG: DnaJ domain-containing protein, partial [Acidimicrobiales bacterium]